ncbi:MAG: glycosyltransferase [Micromonosporaceae bacterium]|nr:glycosyltransferase [Micromonosporaceae bacterium]
MVVPVHQVEPYLPECLDSILASAGSELELVAVDDASPDGSGALLDTYARRDPRVTVLHLAANVGLGRARNAGLDRARGEYVWFVDGDDALPPGSVSAVLDRLAETAPDVLVLDHAELHPDGRLTRTSAGPVLRAVPGPVRVTGRPELLGLPLATSACTKVIRREFLAGTGLRFPPGWYEDCAYTYPLLLAAARVDALDRVCYHYRRRAGAITASVSDRHFDVFEQYDRMWSRVAAVPAPVRGELFRLMIDHLLVIAGNPYRLPPGRRREFFGRVVGQYRRRLPTGGYRLPGGPSGLRHRLVRRNAYPAYAGLRLAWRVAGARRRRLPAGSPTPLPASVPASVLVPAAAPAQPAPRTASAR